MEDTRLITLVQLAQSGDREAFGQLVSEFEPMVYGVVLRRLRNTAEAAEVSQDVFIRALRKVTQLREPERFVGWLKRIAVRLSINRAVRRPKETMQDPTSFSSVTSHREAPWERVLQTERASELHSGLSRLRRLDRETLQAFYFEGQSIQEMSDRFSSPVGTIKRRLHTARNRLKETLSDMQPA